MKISTCFGNLKKSNQFDAVKSKYCIILKKRGGFGGFQTVSSKNWSILEARNKINTNSSKMAFPRFQAHCHLNKLTFSFKMMYFMSFGQFF